MRRGSTQVSEVHLVTSPEIRILVDTLQAGRFLNESVRLHRFVPKWPGIGYNEGPQSDVGFR